MRPTKQQQYAGQIKLIGIQHYDPLGHPHLKQHLDSLKLDRKTPNSVGVEWDEGYLTEIKGQRSNFRKLIQVEYPSFSSLELDLLERSLGYEGDTHCEVWPEVKTLFLDSGRSLLYPDAIQKYSLDRFRIVSKGLQNSDGMDKLQSMSQEFRKSARQTWNAIQDPCDRAAGREKKWIKIITEQADRNLYIGWMILILGESHCQASFPKQLRQLGFDVEVEHI